MNPEKLVDQLINRYPALLSSKNDILSAYKMVLTCFQNGSKLLVCGNGGSAADANHLVAELMKSFALKRPVDIDFKEILVQQYKKEGRLLASKLEKALPAISLSANNALITAIANDTGFEMIYAQQVFGLARSGDVLLAISTSGNSEDVINALLAAKAMGVKTIGLTGTTGAKMSEFCDLCINVKGSNTHEIQELHLPVYHTLCKMLEQYFFYRKK